MHQYRGGPRTTRVVMLEPHRDSQELYADYFKWIGLNKWVGLHVTVVRSAADALRIMARGTHDAFITCLRLPDASGFSVCDALRAGPRTLHLPVIALSTSLADYERAVGEDRFAAVLMKPCMPDVLLESLRNVLAAGYARHDAATHCLHETA